MDTVWEKIKKGLKDGATLSMEKIEEYTKIGKLKIDELSARRKVDRNFADIGERVFELVQDGKSAGIDADLMVKRAVENVVTLKNELVTIAEKIAKIQEEARKGQKDSDGQDDVTGV